MLLGHQLNIDVPVCLRKKNVESLNMYLRVQIGIACLVECFLQQYSIGAIIAAQVMVGRIAPKPNKSNHAGG